MSTIVPQPLMNTNRLSGAPQPPVWRVSPAAGTSGCPGSAPPPLDTLMASLLDSRRPVWLVSPDLTDIHPNPAARKRRQHELCEARGAENDTVGPPSPDSLGRALLLAVRRTLARKDHPTESRPEPASPRRIACQFSGERVEALLLEVHAGRAAHAPRCDRNEQADPRGYLLVA